MSGRYWARTSDPQLVELVLKVRFAALFSAVGTYLGKSHTRQGGFRRSQADDQASASGAYETVPQQCLYFRPEPHQHGSFRGGGHGIASPRRVSSAA